MPLDSPASLRTDDYADLVAYILSGNTFPAGKGEIPFFMYDTVVFDQHGEDGDKRQGSAECAEAARPVRADRPEVRRRRDVGLDRREPLRRHDGRALPEWSMVYIEPDEAAFDITAGPVGLEALVMRFPVNDD